MEGSERRRRRRQPRLAEELDDGLQLDLSLDLLLLYHWLHDGSLEEDRDRVVPRRRKRADEWSYMKREESKLGKGKSGYRKTIWKDSKDYIHTPSPKSILKYVSRAPHNFARNPYELRQEKKLLVTHKSAEASLTIYECRDVNIPAKKRSKKLSAQIRELNGIKI
jgi:hypothetical protein